MSAKPGAHFDVLQVATSHRGASGAAGLSLSFLCQSPQMLRGRRSTGEGERRPVTVLMNSTRRFPVSAATAAERCVQSGPQALNWERRKG